MKNYLLVGVLISAPAFAANPVVEELMNEFRAGSALAFSAEQGRELWTKEVMRNGEARSCASCHTSDLRDQGRHASTGKNIKPLAPSVNPARLTKRADIEKWFSRNCKWTYGRTCTVEEKGHFLAYIQSQ
jgi:cytochrome c peroxidase